ncbi:DUF11 domain-containing protein [Picosynechococcus sp. PCC 11901]|uniref:DUF11 domain-containing protein n=1 Tax=Picosynechococcus sp. PCC 11901 TaxID=2579791 RepID=UPI0010FC2155|nr:DUF11 domain-containing protein [Picosynechococcus sp. PCC 11901]QCS50648.1 DUF11 domain-containing protein [Picosynechococcus sp. PCC 11901]
MPNFLDHSRLILKRSPAAMALVGVGLNLGMPLVLAQTPGTTEAVTLFNRADASYQIGENGPAVNTTSNPVLLRSDGSPPPPPIDPFGRVLGCAGETLDDYSGFRVGLYEAGGSLQTEIGALLVLDPLTGAVPLPPGAVNVNEANANPFDLGNTETLGDPDLRGQFNFFLRPDQLNVGTVYILVIRPPLGSSFDERRIQIRITAVEPDSFTYVANSLDGLPLSLEDPTLTSQEITIPKAETTALIVFSTTVISVCQNEAIQIQKNADRATVEPGGTVVYRLSINNLSTSTLENVEVRDRLPLGFRLLEDSVQGVIGDSPVALDTTVNGRDITFTFQAPFPGATSPENNPPARIIYAVEVTPDALRGDGRNVAFVTGDRQDNNFTVRDGPAVYNVGIRNGLISDLGTIIGRVFEDKNFDGEQQYGEPGIPNAVVFMENGNRIVTDENGLFSVANVLPGWHAGVLDLTSVPGYAPAPNEKFIAEDRTYSRTVRLEPGGMARMNFAVTPLIPGEDE